MAETWVINENIISSYLTGNDVDESINFVVNGIHCTKLTVYNGDVAIGQILSFYSSKTIYATKTFSTPAPPPEPGVLYTIAWTDENENSTSYELTPWKTITFETAPTDALLTWLQANATKQESTSKVSVDLTTLTGWSSLSDGAHNITIVAKADGYADSEPSAAVSVTKATTSGGETWLINDIKLG